MKRVLYFAYGSNLDAEQMKDRCPSARMRFTAKLPDHRLGFTYFSRRWRGGAADLLPARGSSIWGVVYELDEAELPLLDGFEAGYHRVGLTVRRGDGQLQQVLSYSVRGEKGSFPPTPAYRDKMLRWGACWEFPEDYLEALRGLEVRDPA
jgi:gamma-glutamylcyclotransferase (GGCT)/AIG2-like uncharacterized protein YtfP